MSRMALIRGLVRREMGRPAVAMIMAAGVIGVFAGYEAIRMIDSPEPGFMGQAISRFHMTMLRGTAFLVILRTAVRGQEDHAAGWLVPYVAAGGSRAFYAIAVAAAITIAMTALFVAGAGSFAITLLSAGDSMDVLRIMPLLVTGGVLGLLGFALLTALVSMYVRDALATVVVTLALNALPWVAFALVMRGSLTPLPFWVDAMLRVTPGLFIPGSAGAWASRIGFVAVALVAVAAAGIRRTARYA